MIRLHNNGKSGYSKGKDRELALAKLVYMGDKMSAEEIRKLAEDAVGKDNASVLKHVPELQKAMQKAADNFGLECQRKKEELSNGQTNHIKLKGSSAVVQRRREQLLKESFPIDVNITAIYEGKKYKAKVIAHQATGLYIRYSMDNKCERIVWGQVSSRCYPVLSGSAGSTTTDATLTVLPSVSTLLREDVARISKSVRKKTIEMMISKEDFRGGEGGGDRAKQLVNMWKWRGPKNRLKDGEKDKGAKEFRESTLEAGNKQRRKKNWKPISQKTVQRWATLHGKGEDLSDMKSVGDSHLPGNLSTAGYTNIISTIGRQDVEDYNQVQKGGKEDQLDGLIADEMKKEAKASNKVYNKPSVSTLRRMRTLLSVFLKEHRGQQHQEKRRVEANHSIRSTMAFIAVHDVATRVDLFDKDDKDPRRIREEVMVNFDAFQVLTHKNRSHSSVGLSSPAFSFHQDSSIKVLQGARTFNSQGREREGLSQFVKLYNYIGPVCIHITRIPIDRLLRRHMDRPPMRLFDPPRVDIHSIIYQLIWLCFCQPVCPSCPPTWQAPCFVSICLPINQFLVCQIHRQPMRVSHNTNGQIILLLHSLKANWIVRTIRNLH